MHSLSLFRVLLWGRSGRSVRWGSVAGHSMGPSPCCFLCQKCTFACNVTPQRRRCFCSIACNNDAHMYSCCCCYCCCLGVHQPLETVQGCVCLYVCWLSLIAHFRLHVSVMCFWGRASWPHFLSGPRKTWTYLLSLVNTLEKRKRNSDMGQGAIGWSRNVCGVRCNGVNISSKIS